MGIKFFSDSHDSYENYKRNSASKLPNPDPYSFSVVKKELFGEYSLVEAIYFGCTTFNGRKLMLLTTRDIPCCLDPHLLGDDHPVIARFEPNERGWEMARLCATNLMEKTNEKN